jgi:hypothetical protein
LPKVIRTWFLLSRIHYQPGPPLAITICVRAVRRAAPEYGVYGARLHLPTEDRTGVRGREDEAGEAAVTEFAAGAAHDKRHRQRNETSGRPRYEPAGCGVATGVLETGVVVLVPVLVGGARV